MRCRLFAVLSFSLLAASVCAQDVLTVGGTLCRAGTPGSIVTVPVYIRDVPGTPLGPDAGAGKYIEGYAFRVTFTNAAQINATNGALAVSGADAGIITGSLPESYYSHAGTTDFAFLRAFAEAGTTLPFNQTAAAPGDQVATLSVQLAATATPGTTIGITLDSNPAHTVLGNDGGTLGESSGNGLTLVDGCITVIASGGILATGTSTSTIDLSWSGSAPRYKIERRTAALDWTSIGTNFTGNSYTDSGLTASRAYAYRVTPLDAGGNPAGSASAPDLANTYDFGTIAAGQVIRASTMNTFASATNEARTVARIGTASLNVSAGQRISVSDVTALRSAIDGARSGLAMPQFSYTNTLTPQITKMKAQDLLDLREALK